MKRLILTILLVLMILINGCAYRDMNRLQFSTMSIIDMDENNEIVLYSEHFVADRGDTQEGGKISRIVLMSKGSNIGEAYSNSQPSSPYPISYTVKKSIVFTDKLAKEGEGIKDLVDLIERDQKLTNKVFMFICDTDPVSILNVGMADDQFTGIWLEEIMVFQSNQSRILSVRANDYLNNRLKGSRINVLPIITINNQPTENRLIISGAAVIVDDKMVDKLDVDDIPIYNGLVNEISGGWIPVENPQEEGKTLTLTILKNKTNKSIEIIENEINLNIDIKMVCAIATVQGKLDLLNKTVRDELIKAAEKTVEDESSELFYRFKKKGIDILDVQTMINRKYGNNNPDEDFNDILNSVNLNINANILIEGGQNITYSLN